MAQTEYRALGVHICGTRYGTLGVNTCDADKNGRCGRDR